MNFSMLPVLVVDDNLVYSIGSWMKRPVLSGWM